MAKKKPKNVKRGGQTTPKNSTVKGNSKKTPSKKSSFTVEGKSVEELLKNGSAHLHQYKEENLRAIVNRLASAGNKRLRRAEQSGMTDSPAYRDVQSSGGLFTSKGKDLEGLKAEFLRLKSYFDDYTSTQQGWKNVKADTERKARQRGLIGGGTTPNGDDTPKEWTYDPKTRSFYHPDFGGGWVLDDGEYIDPATGVVATTETSPRFYHDFDATQDWRRTATGTETGDIWAMVDSLAKLDPAFVKQVGGYASDVMTLRQMLFTAIDQEYVEHPELTLEEVRDLVMGRLDEIKNQNNEFFGQAAKIGESEFMQ